MEKSDIMKRYEAETGKQSAIVKFMAGGQALESKDFPKIGPYDYSTDYIAWLEAKANISNEAIEAFQEIIRNQCDEISALKEKSAAYDRLMSGKNITMQELANILGKPVAISEHGSLEWFDKVPLANIEMGFWSGGWMLIGNLPSDIVDFTGDWKDSLTLPDGWEEE